MYSDFDLEHLKNNLSMSQGKEYIKQYFVPLTNGNHAVLNSTGKYTIMSDEIVKKVYLNRMPKELSTFYTKEYYAIKSITYKLGEDTIIGNKLNLCPKLKHTYQPFELFDDSIKTKMDVMLDFIKTIICGGKHDSYEFTIKWLANMIRGNKNNSCLYLKDQKQGIGKSTLPEFIKNFVIGPDLCLETGSTPLTSNFNSVLEGKLMVQFEELQNFSASQWMGISSTLKRIITSNRILIEAKNVNSYETENINNYILLSNNDAIKDDEGRRYFILDISLKRKDDHVYFGYLRDTCFNDEVGHAFYCYMLECDLTNYNANKYPMTDSKLDSIAKRLHPVELFVKKEYVLKRKGITKISVDDFHKEYIAFHKSEMSGKPLCKIDMNKVMKGLGMEYIKSSKGNYYNVSEKTLSDISIKEHWIHELDDFDDNENNNNELFTLTDSTELNSLKKENEDLKKRLAEMEQLLEKKNEIHETDDDDDDDDDDDEIIVEDKEEDEQEIEPNLESYQRDYDKDLEMEKIFNELF